METYWDQTVMIIKTYYTHSQAPWLAAVMKDDVETVRKQLHLSNVAEKHLLLEGWISSDSFWSNWIGKEAETQKIMTVERPLSLAAVCGSCRVIDELYKAGIDVFQTDKLGNNVLHTLVIHTSRLEAKESKYLEVLHHFIRLFPEEVFSKLLLSENSSGLRPVELAALFQTLHLIDAMFQSPGPYLNKQATCGTISIDFYDVTEYESDFQRRPWANSPMFLLMFLKCSKLKDEFPTEVVTKGFIGKWLDIRKKIYLPFILLWVAMRLILILIAFFPAGLADAMAPEGTLCGFSIAMSEYVKVTAVIFLIIITALCLLYDIYDTTNYYRLSKPWTKIYTQLPGENVVRYYYYRINQLAMNLVILISCLNRMSWHYWKESVPVYPAQILFVFMVVSSVWSLLYFAQLMPVIGTYVIATQRMLYSLSKFAVVMMIFVLPFAIIFPKFISKNDDGICPDEYSSTASYFYTSFTAMLSMTNFRLFDAPSKESLWLIHVMYTAIVATLLLNFLIAIFADSYTEVANNPEVVANIQWMAMIAVVDFRIPRCLYPLINRMKQRYFSCSDGRLYVKDFSPG